jgi:hypothetical protein
VVRHVFAPSDAEGKGVNLSQEAALDRGLPTQDAECALRAWPLGVRRGNVFSRSFFPVGLSAIGVLPPWRQASKGEKCPRYGLMRLSKLGLPRLLRRAERRSSLMPLAYDAPRSGYQSPMD